MQHILENHPYIQQIIALEKQYEDRTELHKKVGGLLQKMGADDAFIKLVIKRNFEDDGFLKQEWSEYNIPYFFIYETADINVKIHFFPAMEHYVKGTAAHCIHHHNNYILTTAAIFGSGYETMLFDKHVEMNSATLECKLKITKHFTQEAYPVHTIDAWEPHIVYNPEIYSATLQLWTPDQKRNTDGLRTNPLLKALKVPLRKMLYLFGIEKKFGIAPKHTYQWYPEGDHFKAIEENEYFEPTRKSIGEKVNNFSIQTVCIFMQRRGVVDKAFIESILSKKTLPAYYHKWLNMLLNDETIPDSFCKSEINIPQRKYNMQDVINAASAQSI
ncbi:MAG: hypothetical protein PSX81_13585 [bacterium]|nr:hypothetical protein [bacterium]